MSQVCMAEILTPKQRQFRLSSVCLNILASFKLLVCLFSGVQWVGIFHQCSVGQKNLKLENKKEFNDIMWLFLVLL